MASRVLAGLVCLASVTGFIPPCWAESTTSKLQGSVETEVTQAPRATIVRAYVMSGLLGELSATMNPIGERLRARGAVVQVGSWMRESSFVADACTHRQDRVVFIGHSLGAMAAAAAVREAKACGVVRVSMVGIDPPLAATIPPGTPSVNFVGPFNAPVAGAQNVTASGLGHVELVEDSAMQNRIVAAALR